MVALSQMWLCVSLFGLVFLSSKQPPHLLPFPASLPSLPWSSRWILHNEVSYFKDTPLMEITSKATSREIKRPLPARCPIRTAQQCIPLLVLVQGLQSLHHSSNNNNSSSSSSSR